MNQSLMRLWKCFVNHGKDGRIFEETYVLAFGVPREYGDVEPTDRIYVDHNGTIHTIFRYVRDGHGSQTASGPYITSPESYEVAWPEGWRQHTGQFKALEVDL